MAVIQYARCVSETLLLLACSLLVVLVLHLPAIPGVIPFAHLNNTAAYFTTLDTTLPGDLCVWGAVCLWTGVWLVYCWSFICRPKRTRTVHVLTYFLFACCLVCVLVWFYFKRQQRLSLSLGFSILTLLALYLSLLVLLARLYSHASQLDQTQRADLWLTRVLVLNGIALAAGWVEVLVIQDLTRTLKYQGELDDETTALVGLSLLAARLVLYFAVEQTFLDRFVRYMVAQYFVYPWALIWMLVQQASQASGVVSETTSAYTISLLVVAVVMVVAKVVLNSIYACARRIKYPEQEVTYQYM